MNFFKLIEPSPTVNVTALFFAVGHREYIRNFKQVIIFETVDNIIAFTAYNSSCCGSFFVIASYNVKQTSNILCDANNFTYVLKYSAESFIEKFFLKPFFRIIDGDFPQTETTNFDRIE